MLLSSEIVAVFLTGAIIGALGFLLLLRASAGLRESWLLLCVSFSGLQSCVALMNGLRPAFPGALGVVVIPPLQLLAFSLLWAGLRRLRGRPSPIWMMLLPAVAWIAACFVPGYIRSTIMRIVVIVLLTFPLLLAASYEAWAVHREQGLRGSLDLAVLLGLLTAVVPPLYLGALFSLSPATITLRTAFALAILVSAVPFLALSMAHERRRLADAARVAAAARLSSLGEMAAGMAHEVNTPLAVIGLAAEHAAAALEHGDAQSRRHAVERLHSITEAAQRGRSVIDHVRTFARGAQDLSLSGPTSLALVLDGAASLTQGTLRPHGIALDIRLPPEPLVVVGAAVPLEQVFSNLILNAKDAICASGRAGGVIRIQARPRGDGVEVTVDDNGGGIPEAMLPRIFEPFFSTKLSGQGTGLGLSIVQGTMRKLGGTVCASNGHEGACFTLTLLRAS